MKSHLPGHGRVKTCRFTLNTTVAALASAGILSSASVWAQEIIPPAKTEETVVTVTGVRKSAQSAQMIKMKSDEVVDSIDADEAGKFPDKNVAEILGRVTGVQIKREIGEAIELYINDDITTTPPASNMP